MEILGGDASAGSRDQNGGGVSGSRNQIKRHPTLDQNGSQGSGLVGCGREASNTITGVGG